MKWFKHDTDANLDAKLQGVLLDYGLEGYGLYWYCVELIAGKVECENLTFELEHDARIIARNTGCTQQKVQEMMKYFIDLELFENTNGVVTCFKLAKRLDQSMTSNPKMRAMINNIKNHDSVMTQSCKNRLEQNRKDNINYQSFVDVYHELLPNNTKVGAITSKRKTSIKTFSEKYKMDLDKFRNYLTAIDQYCKWMTEPYLTKSGNTKKNGFDYFVSDRCYQLVKDEAADSAR